MIGNLWHLARHFKSLLAALVLMLILAPAVLAAVDVTDLTLSWETDHVLVSWETASETDNSGFYVWRRTGTEGTYEDVSGFIPSEGQVAGALYEYEDSDVNPGVTYYYRIQDIPNDGTTGDFFYPDPTSITIPGDDTTPTATPTATRTPTPTPPPDGPTPEPSVRFWAEETDLAAGECTTVRWDAQGVQTLYLDGIGVQGVGVTTYCPCEDETHVLAVTYADGSTENFTLTLTATGECTEQQRTPSPTPTATPDEDAPTPTLTPTTERAQSTATATPTDEAATQPSPTATPTPAQQAAEVTATPTPTATATYGDEEPLDVTPAQLTPTRADVMGDASDEPGQTGNGAWMTILLLLAGLLIGSGLVGGGIWFWKQQQ